MNNDTQANKTVTVVTLSQIIKDMNSEKLFAWLIVSVAFSFMLLAIIVAQFLYYAKVTRQRQQVL